MFLQLESYRGSYWIEFHKLDSLEEYWGMFAVNEGVIKNPLLYEWFFRISRFLILLGILSVVGYYKRLRLGLAACLFMLVNIYLVSFFITPVLYSRYLSILSPFVVIGTFIGLITVRKFSKFGFWAIFLIYITLNTLILREYVLRPSRTRYAHLQNITDARIYTSEVLDVTPCIYYSDRCYFVGDISKTARHVGPAQLASLPSISSWNEVEGDKIYVLQRKDLPSDVLELLASKSYGRVDHLRLGNSTNLVTYQKDSF
jgi:hypothetical protein